MAKKKDELKGEMIHRSIEKYINNEVNYIEAIIQYAEDNDLEVELIASIVRKSPILKNKIKTDAVKLLMVEEDTPKS